MNEMVERVARAIREEIARQYRDDDRSRFPGGASYYEQHIGPHHIARAAIAAMREPTDEMVDAGAIRALPFIASGDDCDVTIINQGWRVMIDAALAD